MLSIIAHNTLGIYVLKKLSTAGVGTNITIAIDPQPDSLYNQTIPFRNKIDSPNSENFKPPNLCELKENTFLSTAWI